MKTLIIDRLTWLRGQGRSQLRRVTDGKMCCLGFECIQLHALTEGQITGLATPAHACAQTGARIDDLAKLDSGNLFMNTPLCGDLMATNDDKAICDYEREAKLRDLFNKRGISPQFIN